MKNTLIIIALLFFYSSVWAQPKIIAHRGYWDCKGSAKNSITSLNKAHTLAGVYASELDVHITVDGVVIVNHDPTIEGHTIETSLYKDIKDSHLINGEKYPTFKQYIKQARKNDGRLVIEIKEHNLNPEVNEERVIEAVLSLVNKNKMKDKVEYISFSLNACKLLKKIDPTVKVAYLPHKVLSPRQVKAEGLDGIDYRISIFNKHPEWIKEAHNLGLTVNVYTPNNKELIQQFIDMNVDFITTDNPVLAISLLKNIK